MGRIGCLQGRHMFVVKCPEPLLPFAKHELSQVDDGYLRWMQAKMGVVTKELQQRNFQHQAGKRISVQGLLADLKACRRTQDLQRGKKVHAAAVECGYDSNIYVMSSLVSMYAKCGSVAEARRVFDSIQKPDVVCWNALLLGYAENGEGHIALDLFSSMKASACAPDFVTYLASLKACASLAVDGDKKNCLQRGRQIHLEIGPNLNQYVQSTLIDMYAKCGSMAEAHRVFDGIHKPDAVCWNALLMGYAENGEGIAALDLFSTMKATGCAPVSLTYVAALKSCASLAVNGNGSVKKYCLERGIQIHSEIGNNLHHYVRSTLIDMYAKCGSMPDARRVFNSIPKADVVSWNALLLGYAENGEGLVALDLFSGMKASGCAPDSVTYVAAVKACTSLAADGDVICKKNCLERGRVIHLEIGGNINHYVQNTLIDMYANCGSMVEAHSVFDSIQNPKTVSWNVLLLGYADNGEGLVTLDLFSSMKASGCTPDSVTYVAALKACGLIGALALGRKVHSEITEFSAHVVTCLVDFYGKCGSMVEAHEVFNLHPKARDITTWNALLAGYGRFGVSDCVFNLFDAMQDEGYRPDNVTFVHMLSCCSHAGLVKEAREYFEAMDGRFGLTRNLMHYNCMIDVLGRANLLKEAVVLLLKMSCNPDAVTWMALLSACHKWKNVEIGRMAFQCLMGKKEEAASAHVLMAHIYGSKGMLEEQERVLGSRTKVGAWRLQGQAYVLNEVGKMVKFVGGECGPQEVEDKMQQFGEDMKQHGYVLTTTDAEALCGHSVRRAVVYGILKTPSAEPVRVFMDLRMCDECHATTRIISKLSGRVLMIRDATRFHVMVNGSCSCGD